MKKYIERKIVEIETANTFNPKWYGIFVNPFFITRRHLHKNIKIFADSCGENKKILDVGCGIKPYAKLFSKNEYVGIEIEGGGHKDDAKKADQFFDGKNIPFSNETFDVIISSEVFEHVEDLDYLLKEINRVLKTNGVLFVTMPFVWAEHEIPYDFRRFTSFGHLKILKENDFSDIFTHSTTGTFGTVGQIVSDFLIGEFSRMLEKLPSSGLGYKFKFIVSRLFVFLFCFPVQLIFLGLDKLFGYRGITLDFIVVAKKS